LLDLKPSGLRHGGSRDRSSEPKVSAFLAVGAMISTITIPAGFVASSRKAAKPPKS
jgi:hypothetical protein